MKISGLVGLFLLVVSVLNISPAIGQTTETYRIGAEDVLEIRFWQKPDINAEVRVSLDGTITLDKIGQIEVVGKTTEELQADIVRRISRLDEDVWQVVVRVSEFNYNLVYVTGEVRLPGKLSFEVIPDLWALINEAGGITDLADLTRVTIVRGGDRTGEVEVVNVSRAIATGTLSSLPKIGRLDTIELPGNLLGLPSRELAQQEDLKNVVYVVGAVTRPGPITFEENTDILEAISMAGGPLANANLKDARLVSIDGRYGQSLQIDLEKYTKSGKPARYILKKEDTIFLPANPEGSFLQRNVGTIVTVLGVITSGLLIYDQLRPADDPPTVSTGQ